MDSAIHRIIIITKIITVIILRLAMAAFKLLLVYPYPLYRRRQLAKWQRFLLT
jgi:hypothetical protein